ncbi:MAG TPA: FtsX-like permease family protein [Ohtaekwangia sp.]|uniref:ABC transporter permease n=1 Tax=Ohtaekwangia sp. TaxID=2066019 RepID=UPI002F958A85
MLTNYLKTFVRSLLRSRIYSIINIFGLTLGITTALFIGLWINDELTFDRYFDGNDQIYEVMNNKVYPDGHIETWYSTQGLIASELVANYPAVETAARVDWPVSLLLSNGDRGLMQNVLWADPQIMQVFSFKVIEGDASNPVPNKNSIVITRSAAQRYFPSGSAIGKIFRLDNKHDLQVSAVVEDNRPNSFVHFDVLAPYHLLLDRKPWVESWDSEESLTFVKLRSNTDVDALNGRIKGMVKEHCNDCISEIFLYPFGDLHLYGNFNSGKADGGRIAYVKIIFFIGFFILLIACINFMNLATARSSLRGREIGVRKVVGASRQSLSFQFICEATLMALISTIVAVAATQTLLPFFNSITSKNITIDYSPTFIGAVIAFGCLVGVMAGSYPALYLSAIKAAAVLKGQNHFGGARLRQSLVVFQFMLAVILMVCSVVVYQQLDFIKKKNLGFDRENVIGFSLREGVSNNKNAFKNEVLNEPSVKRMTFSGNGTNPFSISAHNSAIFWPGKPVGDVTNFRIVFTDKDFVSTMKMTIIAGRDFVDDEADSMSYLINEKAVEIMGLKDAIGTPVVVEAGDPGHIVGVIKDWNNQNLQNEIEPVIVLCLPRASGTAFARIENGNVDKAIEAIAAAQKKFDPSYPFDYYFLNERFESEYRSENSLQNLSLVFTFIAIVISCLGLFGLASFTAERRTKELGIRKVLGANVRQLISMLCYDFMRLVLISLIIGVPFAWFIMDDFLSGYTYRTEITWFVFALTAFMLLAIAMITVVWQALRAATTNPVESLRAD